MKYTGIDLFSGCGGLSLGASWAGQQQVGNAVPPLLVEAIFKEIGRCENGGTNA